MYIFYRPSIACLSIFIGVIFLVGCHSKSQLLRKRIYFVPSECQKSKNYKQDHWITVWVHGARPFGNDTQKYGLCHADEFEPSCDLNRLEKALYKADQVMFNPQNFYIYSWPGDLDFDERDAEGKNLYNQLVELTCRYKKENGVIPKIRLIAHSHGGNVALAMAPYNSQSCLVVDELFLLAVPVQVRTRSYIQSSMFKRVFALYSTLDIGQVGDPQGLYKNSGTSVLFSNFRFNVQENLLQVHTLLNGRACTHAQFIFDLLPLLPAVIKELNDWADHLPEAILADPRYHYTLALFNDGRTLPSFIPRNLRPEYVLCTCRY